MNYRLSFQSETYPVEDIQIAPESTMEQQPVGEPFSFVAPVKLAIGQSCTLHGDSGSYSLLVNSCAGFTYSMRYLVSGVIARKVAPAVAAR